MDLAKEKQQQKEFCDILFDLAADQQMLEDPSRRSKMYQLFEPSATTRNLLRNIRAGRGSQVTCGSDPAGFSFFWEKRRRNLASGRKTASYVLAVFSICFFLFIVIND